MNPGGASDSPGDLGALPAGVRIAVLLPCYNEAGAIAQTVAEFRTALPQAAIYVYDNNSSDGSREIAAAAGAIVRQVRQQGKGHVVRRMFADVDADIYIMADGDATYEAAAAPAMIGMMLDQNFDMVVGARRTEVEAAYRRGHRLGNKMLTGLLKSLFGRSFTDILSGYRVFSRRFVKSFPVLSAGFEIETEMSVHALELAMPESARPLRLHAPLLALTKADEVRLARELPGCWDALAHTVTCYRGERPGCGACPACRLRARGFAEAGYTDPAA